MKKWIKRTIDVGCIGLASSVFMDSVLWVTGRHWIPCWTMAAMSLGMILLLQVVKVIGDE